MIIQTLSYFRHFWACTAFTDSQSNTLTLETAEPSANLAIFPDDTVMILYYKRKMIW